MNDYSYKLDNFLFPLISNFKNPKILELGVQKGVSTLKFLELCNANDGYLFSVDIADCSTVTNDKRWKFILSKDDNFKLIKNEIPKKLDIIFIDSVHEAKHVSKIFYNYYNQLNVGGYIFIDDISHLPYIDDNKKSSFYCEINNKETFNELLKINFYNQDCFDLSFSFKSSGLAIIKKKNNLILKKSEKLNSREYSFRNLFRKIWLNIKKNY